MFSTPYDTNEEHSHNNHEYLNWLESTFNSKYSIHSVADDGKIIVYIYLFIFVFIRTLRNIRLSFEDFY